MAECPGCGEEMLVARSCAIETVMIGGAELERIRYGFERYADAEGRCHDCGVARGGIHHLFCDFEECPVCRGQLLSCDHGLWVGSATFTHPESALPSADIG
jgi:hypothetical protein